MPTFSLIPQLVFTEPEDTLFDDLVDEAEIDAIVDALFPAALTDPDSSKRRR